MLYYDDDDDDDFYYYLLFNNYCTFFVYYFYYYFKNELIDAQPFLQITVVKSMAKMLHIFTSIYHILYGKGVYYFSYYFYC